MRTTLDLRPYKPHATRDSLLTTKEVAARWGYNESSVARMRNRNYGPRHCTLGRNIRYRLSDVLAWENSA